MTYSTGCLLGPQQLHPLVIIYGIVSLSAMRYKNARKSIKDGRGTSNRRSKGRTHFEGSGQRGVISSINHTHSCKEALRVGRGRGGKGSSL